MTPTTQTRRNASDIIFSIGIFCTIHLEKGFSANASGGLFPLGFMQACGPM